MARGKSAAARHSIGAQCDCDCQSFPVAISDISPDGCCGEAAAGWQGEDDFIHLTIADRIHINGRIAQRMGRKATIRFFGQIHPCVVDQLSRRAA